ncbi:hypothetical protein BD779DRAFT_1409204, partial [Infundibulicybe gibba]
TNRAPTDSEVARSRDVVNSAEKRVLQIQAEADNLAREELELSNLIKTHKAAISPLKRFPPELLAKIFVECTNLALDDWDYLHARTCPPLMLIGVCSRWREIASNTPQLW